jgi:hypothetical protein
MSMGVFKIVSMRIHSIVEMIVGPVLIIGAFLLPGLALLAQYYFVAAGLTIIAVWYFSDYE